MQHETELVGIPLDCILARFVVKMIDNFVDNVKEAHRKTDDIEEKIISVVSELTKLVKASNALAA